MTRKTIAVLLVVAAGIAAGMCAIQGGAARQRTLVADLTDSLNQAERRPAGAPFDVTPLTIGTETHRAISTPGASRITWELMLPDNALIEVAVALKPEAWTQEGDGVLFRVGIAEGRTHEDLTTRLVNPYGQADDRKWIPLWIDLGAYSGFKWSLFYHPRRLTWRLVFNTNAGVPGSTDSRGDLPVWGDPRVLGSGSK